MTVQVGPRAGDPAWVDYVIFSQGKISACDLMGPNYLYALQPRFWSRKCIRCGMPAHGLHEWFACQRHCFHCGRIHISDPNNEEWYACHAVPEWFRERGGNPNKLLDQRAGLANGGHPLHRPHPPHVHAKQSTLRPTAPEFYPGQPWPGCQIDQKLHSVVTDPRPSFGQSDGHHARSTPHFDIHALHHGMVSFSAFAYFSAPSFDGSPVPFSSGFGQLGYGQIAPFSQGRMTASYDLLLARNNTTNGLPPLSRFPWETQSPDRKPIFVRSQAPGPSPVPKKRKRECSSDNEMEEKQRSKALKYHGQVKIKDENYSSTDLHAQYL